LPPRIGLDIVHVPSVPGAASRDGATEGVRALFAASELLQGAVRNSVDGGTEWAVLYSACLWAIKEAVAKAIGIGIGHSIPAPAGGPAGAANALCALDIGPLAVDAASKYSDYLRSSSSEATYPHLLHASAAYRLAAAVPYREMTVSSLLPAQMLQEDKGDGGAGWDFVRCFLAPGSEDESAPLAACLSARAWDVFVFLTDRDHVGALVLSSGALGDTMKWSNIAWKLDFRKDSVT
jgi:hypothetical protein